MAGPDDKNSDLVSPPVHGRLVGAAGERDIVWRVPEEAPIAILLNGQSFAVMMATPADLEDFARGFALTEGIVTDPAQLRDLVVGEASDGYVVNLKLDPDRATAAEDRRRSIPGRSGCGICGAQTIGAALPKLPRVAGILPKPEAVLETFGALPGVQDMNAENRSTHAAAFCDRAGRIMLVREDIGRHNALDKLAGAMQVRGLKGADGFILMSSRISIELVQKAAILGVPLLAAVSSPSALALRQAAAVGMTLACLAKDGLMMFDKASMGVNAA